MGAAAKLKRVRLAIASFARAIQHTHRDHPNLIAVFLAKQRLSADGTGVVGGHDTGVDGRILANESVDLRLYRRQIGGRDRSTVAEVEPQPIRCIQRPALCDMVAKRAAQRLVQQMRRRMVGTDLRPAGVGNLQLCGLTFQKIALQHAGHVDEDASGLLHIGHFGHTGVGADQA